MRILGIDPGYERLGVAVLEKNGGKECVLFSACFKTSPKLEFPERLNLVGEEIERIIQKYKLEVLAIETLFLNTNQKTAMRVAEVRGVALNEAVKRNLKVFEASPPQIKVAIAGYGRADKQQIKKMVKMLVNIEVGRESDDELDAIAIALTAFAHLGNGRVIHR